MSQPTCEAEALELFEVRGIDNSPVWDGETKQFQPKGEPATRLMNAAWLESHKKYSSHSFKPVEETSLGRLWPQGVTIAASEVGQPWNCCRTQDYEVSSPVELTDRDFVVLRAQGCFMSGQECGVVQRGEKQPDGSWKYQCRSLCDSSD